MKSILGLFKYCECGCKGYEANIGNHHYSYYWNLGPENEKSYLFSETHNARLYGKEYITKNELITKMRTVMKRDLSRTKKELNLISKYFE